MDDVIKKVDELDHKSAEESDPYKHKYESRKILENNIEMWKKIITDNPNSTPEKIQTLNNEINIMKFYLALNFINTEERSSGEPLLQEVIAYFKPNKQLRINFGYILLQALNWAAIIWSSRSDNQHAKKFLDQSDALYNESKNNTEMMDQSTMEAFEREYTHTLFYFAQLYGNIGSAAKSALYCQKTLHRQLEDSQTLDNRDWTMNALKLSDYYVHTKKYRQAIHCIEAACAVAPPLNKEVEDDQQLEADIAQGWGRLYLELLKDSYAVMSGDAEDEETDNEPDSDTKEEESAVKDIVSKPANLVKLGKKLKIDNTIVMFPNLQLGIPPEMQLASTFEEARELFVPGLKHLMAALQYYVLDGFVTDHITISQSVSSMYKFLAFFEKNPSTQCKMLKRRINLLEEIESSISPQAYSDLIQEMCFEIGCTYDEMGTIKQKQIETLVSSGDKKPTSKQLKKMNELFTKAIHYISKFVEFFEFPPDRRREESKKPAKIDESNWISYLQGHFLLAALYGKLQYSDAKAQLDVAKKSMKGYQHVIDYCTDKGPIAGFDVQLQIATSMKDLLPLKIQKLALIANR